MELKDFKYTIDYSKFPAKKETKHEYDLYSPEGRRLYFNAKAGEEIELIREYMKNSTFVAYMLAPKQAGKGTYTAMLKEVIGSEYMTNLSVGDVVRAAELEYNEKGKDSELYQYAQKNYRGFLSLDEAFDALTNRSVAKLIPDEFVMILIKHAMAGAEKKSIFLDGFPRTADQVAYSLLFRELINYRDDPDFFVLINVPMAIIDDRIKERLVCPKCNTSRNLRLNPTSKVNFDNKTGKYGLLCDNPECSGEQMVAKEGDDKGIMLIESRIKTDLDLMVMARKMYGISKIELYNSIEVDRTAEFYDDYEMTQENYYEGASDCIVKKTRPYQISENGMQMKSLTPAPVVLQFIHQLVEVLGLRK